jgi:spore germination cell wall hydrolase CwlJ-like protein
MDDALFYHATYVRPYWARTKDRLTRIGLHIFYEQA